MKIITPGIVPVKVDVEEVMTCKHCSCIFSCVIHKDGVKYNKGYRRIGWKVKCPTCGKYVIYGNN
jgi:hypothetical protein